MAECVNIFCPVFLPECDAVALLFHGVEQSRIGQCGKEERFVGAPVAPHPGLGKTAGGGDDDLTGVVDDRFFFHGRSGVSGGFEFLNQFRKGDVECADSVQRAVLPVKGGGTGDDQSDFRDAVDIGCGPYGEIFFLLLQYHLIPEPVTGIVPERKGSACRKGRIQTVVERKEDADRRSPRRESLLFHCLHPVPYL